jgi:6-phosphogluconate dehydrogenase
MKRQIQSILSFNNEKYFHNAAIDEGVPVPALTAALYERFSSRGEADYADRVLSAMRFGFGGHLEKQQAKAA